MFEIGLTGFEIGLTCFEIELTFESQWKEYRKLEMDWLMRNSFNKFCIIMKAELMVNILFF